MCEFIDVVHDHMTYCGSSFNNWLTGSMYLRYAVIWRSCQNLLSKCKTYANTEWTTTTTTIYQPFI